MKPTIKGLACLGLLVLTACGSSITPKGIEGSTPSQSKPTIVPIPADRNRFNYGITFTACQTDEIADGNCEGSTPIPDLPVQFTIYCPSEPTVVFKSKTDAEGRLPTLRTDCPGPIKVDFEFDVIFKNAGCIISYINKLDNANNRKMDVSAEFGQCPRSNPEAR